MVAIKKDVEQQGMYVKSDVYEMKKKSMPR
jgi:hypothetical protein